MVRSPSKKPQTRAWMTLIIASVVVVAFVAVILTQSQPGSQPEQRGPSAGSNPVSRDERRDHPEEHGLQTSVNSSKLSFMGNKWYFEGAFYVLNTNKNPVRIPRVTFLVANLTMVDNGRAQANASEPSSYFLGEVLPNSSRSVIVRLPIQESLEKPKKIGIIAFMRVEGIEREIFSAFSVDLSNVAGP